MTEHDTVDQADLAPSNPVVVTDTLIATGYLDEQGNFIADESQPKTEIVAFVQQESEDKAE